MSARKKPIGPLLLRTCNTDMTSSHGFRWPRPDEDLGHGPGIAVADDWKPTADCGNGLHGLVDGRGDASLLNWAADAVWMVVEQVGTERVDLSGKVKVRSAKVLFAGEHAGALAVLRSAGVADPLPGDVATAGYGGTATAGYAGTATAGYAGTATAGYAGTATAGDRGTATAGYSGTATAGYRGTAIAGDRGTATAGDSGTATAGDSGTATAGDRGTATAGDSGTATAGYSGTATAGYRGTIVIKWWDGKRYRLVVGYIGEDGLLPNTPYRLNASHEFGQVSK